MLNNKIENYQKLSVPKFLQVNNQWMRSWLSGQVGADLRQANAFKLT